MHIHGAILNIDILAPDIVQQLFTAVNPLRMSHKKVQQLEFGRSHFQRILITGYAVGCRVECQAVHGDKVIRRHRGDAPQNRFNTGH